MLLPQAMVGDRVVYGSARGTCIAPRRGAGTWHGCSKLPRCGCTVPARDAGPADPMEGQQKPQGRASLLQLSWKHREEGRMLLEKRSWKS